MVVWIIGLSGAGKTTLATEVVRQLRTKVPNVVLIDGDTVREMFGNDLGHSIEGRRRNADRICRLCKLLDSQGIHVICAILSLFPESREWNRQNLPDYYEVYIDTPIDDLKKRDSKGLYGRFARGEIREVAGMDIEFPVPDRAHLVILNSQSRGDLVGYSSEIVDHVLGHC
jgi:adenylylsulfate kinase-like enzyme